MGNILFQAATLNGQDIYTGGAMPTFTAGEELAVAYEFYTDGNTRDPLLNITVLDEIFGQLTCNVTDVTEGATAIGCETTWTATEGTYSETLIAVTAVKNADFVGGDASDFGVTFSGAVDFTVEAGDGGECRGSSFRFGKDDC